MSITPALVLSEARAIVTRLHDQDKQADFLISRANNVNEKICCMKQYQEDLQHINQVSKQRPRSHLVLSLQKENKQIRALQEENRELKLSLEAHQSTLEMIMMKYRSHVYQFIQLKNIENELITKINSPAKEVAADRFPVEHELAQMFSECLRLGEQQSHRLNEEAARLRLENQVLREVLRLADVDQRGSLSKQFAKQLREIMQEVKAFEAADEHDSFGQFDFSSSQTSSVIERTVIDTMDSSLLTLRTDLKGTNEDTDGAQTPTVRDPGEPETPTLPLATGSQPPPPEPAVAVTTTTAPTTTANVIATKPGFTKATSAHELSSVKSCAPQPQSNSARGASSDSVKNGPPGKITPAKSYNGAAKAKSPVSETNTPSGKERKITPKAYTTNNTNSVTSTASTTTTSAANSNSIAGKKGTSAGVKSNTGTSPTASAVKTNLVRKRSGEVGPKKTPGASPAVKSGVTKTPAATTTTKA